MRIDTGRREDGSWRKKDMLSDYKIKKILDLLEDEYPMADCALEHRNVYELLVAVTLSAQTTDVSVNRVSGELFEKYPSPEALAGARPEDVEKVIKPTGMYKTKAANIIKQAQMLVDDFGGNVPEDDRLLQKLPGVGRKTANVVMSVGFGHQRIAVDTHVFRVAARIGLAEKKNVLDTEETLMEILPKKRWTRTHHSLIFHGRNCCTARNPGCERCCIRRYCEKNGV